MSDWYDSVVGGFQQRDITRGRLYRIAPPGRRYTLPDFHFESPGGAVEALKSANYCARSKAWHALMNMGSGAEEVLAALFRSSNVRHRARALWVLGNLRKNGEQYIRAALEDPAPEIRLTALRLARQKKVGLPGCIGGLADDPSPHVRAECAIALTHLDSPEKAGLWAKLALHHDGEDRWYLEALGIGAEGAWEACFAAWMDELGGKWNTKAGRDIVWRSRSKEAPALLAEILRSPSTPKEDYPRYFRALDFHEGPEKDAALKSLLGAGE